MSRIGSITIRSSLTIALVLLAGPWSVRAEFGAREAKRYEDFFAYFQDLVKPFGEGSVPRELASLLQELVRCHWQQARAVLVLAIFAVGLYIKLFAQYLALGYILSVLRLDFLQEVGAVVHKRWSRDIVFVPLMLLTNLAHGAITWVSQAYFDATLESFSVVMIIQLSRMILEGVHSAFNMRRILGILNERPEKRVCFVPELLVETIIIEFAPVNLLSLRLANGAEWWSGVAFEDKVGCYLLVPLLFALVFDVPHWYTRLITSCVASSNFDSAAAQLKSIFAFVYAHSQTVVFLICTIILFVHVRSVAAA